MLKCIKIYNQFMTSEFKKRSTEKMLSKKEFNFAIAKIMKKKYNSNYNNDSTITEINNCGGYCGCTNNDQGGLFGYGVITGNSRSSLGEDMSEFNFNASQ